MKMGEADLPLSVAYAPDAGLAFVLVVKGEQIRVDVVKADALQAGQASLWLKSASRAPPEL